MQKPKLLLYRSDANMTVRLEGVSPKPIWHRILNALSAAGYRVGRDPEIEKHYRCLSQGRRYGRHGDLEFKSECTDWSRLGRKEVGGSFSFKFYQNLFTKHPAGGYFDSDPESMMPYLVKLRYWHARALILKMLVAEGFEDHSSPKWNASPAMERIIHAQRESGHCKVGPMEWVPKTPSNRRDGDGNELSPGDVRYCYNYTGHLIRVTVYYSLNNMWYAIAGPQTILQKACSELFAWRPELIDARRRPVDPVKKVEDALKRAVKSLDFERAIVCRNWLRARNIEPKLAA